MTLSALTGLELELSVALLVGAGLAALACVIVMPRAIAKLKGAEITGRDRNKPHAPLIPEMGGLGIFLAFNVGVFGILAVAALTPEQTAAILASLVVAAGACMTGVLDDLIVLRQRFKAFIPLAFAAPLAIFATDTAIEIPLVGAIDFGLAYVVILLPLGVCCASNGFNMLEGFNGLGASIGIVLGAALSALAYLNGNLTGLVVLLPLIGALAGFLLFNWYPARIFPGDTMTLLVGAVLALGAILSKVEFWGFILFIPHVVEFFLKARAGFKAQCFADRVEPDGTLVYAGPTRSLTHVVMKRARVTERGVVLVILLGETLLAGAVLLGAWLF